MRTDVKHQQELVAEAALALAALMGLPGLPPVRPWTINPNGVAVAQTGGVVTGQLDIHGLPTKRASEVKLSALAALAARFDGVVRTRDLPSSDVLVHTHVEFEYRGVRFAVWAHVLPEELRPAETAAAGHPDVDGASGVGSDLWAGGPR